jgi:hypothetical protein
MQRRLWLLAVLFTTVIVLGAGCAEEDDNELVALGGKYYATFMNGAGFAHDTVLVTVSDSHDIRLSSSDGRLVDTQMEGITRDGEGSYYGTVQLEDTPSLQVAEVVLVVADDQFSSFRITLNGVVVESSVSDRFPWDGDMHGELYDEGGNHTGTFTAFLTVGAAQGSIFVDDPEFSDLTGYFSDLGLGHLYTVEGWPARGLALLGWLWIEADYVGTIHGSGEWSSVEGGPSGTWTTE